ncbi:MAG: molybdopterin-dependent oxidoreductase, partial [Flavobacteriaceae bacterium]|nr:molybdopterin-dependent oxidoreductase [Flavobacteriaceae bacterium]
MNNNKNIDSFGHVRGESLFIDDIIVRQDTLYGLVFDSHKAHGIIKKLNITKATSVEGVIKIFTYEDIPGENQIGGIIPDEPLLAEKEVHYCGQPIAFIVARSEKIAKKARALIEIEIDELPVVTSAKEAASKELFISEPRTFTLGNTRDAFVKCDYIFEDEVFTNGQEHLYLETQGAYTVPMENGNLKITSSTQGPTQVQKAVAKVLNISMNKIEVDVIRLGGGFGGKEDQATAWAVMTALATFKLKKPVKFILNRHDDLRMTGKRHPYESNFKIGLSKDLKIIAFEADFYQNAGAAADLSTAVAERTLFHATNSYFIKNVKTSVYSCKTNLPPNTAFRGFGGPQGMFLIEAAIAKAAHEIGVNAKDIQENNLL